MEELMFTLFVPILSDVIAKVLSLYIENGVRLILKKHRHHQQIKHKKS